MNQLPNDPAKADAEPSPSDTTAPTPRRRAGRALLLGTLAVPALLAGLGLAAYWALGSEAGSRWLLARVPGLEVDAPAGSLLGDFSARQLNWLGSDGTRVSVSGLRWQGLRLAWNASPQLWGDVIADSLRADRLSVSWVGSDAASPPPSDVQLPLGLQLGRLQITELLLPSLDQLRLEQLDATLALSADGGREHRVQLHGLRWQQLQLQGDARVQTGGEMQLQAELKLQGPNTPLSALDDQPPLPWQARLQLQGPLLNAAAQLRLQAAGQSLQAQAQLRPFAPWPLAALSAQANNFDLAALHPHWPQTRLSGRANLQATAADKPMRLELQLSNSAAGRWDQGKLPVQRLHTTLELLAGQRLRIEQLQAELGSAAQAGGSLSAEGQLQLAAGTSSGDRLKATLHEVQPAALDGRAAPMRIRGQLQAQQAKLGGNAPLEMQAQLSAELQRQDLPAAARQLQLQLRASLQGRQLLVSEARLQAGSASAALQGQVLREAQGGWHASGSAELKEFDPTLFLQASVMPAVVPGSSKATTGASPRNNQLNAQLALDLQQAPGQPGRSAASWPSGQATLRLLPGLLAGQALAGELHYQRDAGGNQQRASVQGQLQVANNTLKAELQGADSEAPRLDLKLQAAQLDRLQPLLRLALPEAQLAGAAELQVQAQAQRTGKLWQFNSTATGSASELLLQASKAAAPLRLAKSSLAWQADSRLDAPLLLQASVDQLKLGAQTVPHAEFKLDGSWARHRLSLQSQGRLPLPAWAARALMKDASQPAQALLAQLQLGLAGSLDRAPWQAWQDGAPLNWQASALRLQAGSQPQPASGGRPAVPAEVWLKAQDLALQLRWSRETGLGRLSLAPGRLTLAGNAALHWQQLFWQAGRSRDDAAQLQADVELEPLAVAPLLAFWQPDFGWGGDLVVGGRLRLSSTPRTQLELLLQRQRGDLSVTEERGVQALGLSELRLALNADNGVWSFTQALAGSNLGGLGGSLVVRGDPAAPWPSANAPLEGVLQANVANLSTWGAWVPAGWRLGGELQAGLSFGGTLGARSITGRASGQRIELRNPLQGVDMQGGEFLLTLQPGLMQLEQLRLRGGDGQISGQGRLQMPAGGTPALDLQLRADRFALLKRVDRRLLTSGEVHVRGGNRQFDIDGKLRVDEGLIDFSRGDAPSLDDDVKVQRPEQAVAEAASSNDDPVKVHVQLALDLGEQLKLRGRGLDTRLQGQLSFNQQDGAQRLEGKLRTVGGTYDAYGQKLEIERGEISFAGAVDNPRLDVLAVRPNTDVRVGVTLTGTAQAPRIKLFSEPELPETDKLSWLVMGRAPDGLGRADTALLQRAALALLTGEGESSSGKLMKNLGLDELSVRQGGEDDTRGTVVRLGKQLSRRWYLGYERGINATTGSWQLIYRIAQRFTLRAQSGDDNALELIWQWRWE
ncbi:translocation/assembly module TamB domain-containing protein [Paucibacter sp. APW11]|uniref:Translocation/assembly module TamB domain-containing protein n=1 Tax=Roseateles aquae TaxID=3077235 RepID=A0ABU3PGM0_9BURK|nr:translocation/assembly module TamB domain-containing protein [Paucibacter sp. APW11]MDT9001497.1 translocation/assembly module TamB domain-containing protein [Paucibacter sp. APW11]